MHGSNGRMQKGASTGIAKSRVRVRNDRCRVTAKPVNCGGKRNLEKHWDSSSEDHFTNLPPQLCVYMLVYK